MTLLSEVRTSINEALLEFVRTENKYLNEIGSELVPVANAMERFLLDSGKRLRPIFSYVGFLGTGSKPTPEIIKACASLELVHVCALMHDDVMDGSDTRRGAPAIHRAFEQMHIENKLHGSSEQFGISAAILLGDLALVWSAKMLHQAGLSNDVLVRALEMYDEMRVELMAGQYLDVYEQALGSQSVERSLKVARYTQSNGRFILGLLLEVPTPLPCMRFIRTTVYPLAKPSNFATMFLESLAIQQRLENLPVMICEKVKEQFFLLKLWSWLQKMRKK